MHHAHRSGAGGIEFEDLAQPGPEGWNGSVVALPPSLIALAEKITSENRLEKQGVAAERIGDELFPGSLNRGLKFSLGGGKHGGWKAGQQRLFFHTNKPYAGPLFVLLFEPFFDEKLLKFVPFVDTVYVNEGEPIEFINISKKGAEILEEFGMREGVIEEICPDE